MRRIALFVSLLCSAVAWAGTQPNSADYTLSVHVSSACLDDRGLVRLKVVVNGKKYELEGADNESSLLAPGDYQARSMPVRVKDAHAYDVHGSYEFLFPDKKTRSYAVVGVME
jgi:hypothetical protein